MEQGPKNYVLNENLLNTLVGYLANQPYRQVSGLLAELSQLPLVQITASEQAPTKSKSQEKREAIQAAAKKV